MRGTWVGQAWFVLRMCVRVRFYLGDERSVWADERYLQFRLGVYMIQPWQAEMVPPHTRMEVSWHT